MTTKQRALEALEVAERDLADYADQIAGPDWHDHMTAEQVVLAAAEGAGDKPWWLLLKALEGVLRLDAAETEDPKQREQLEQDAAELSKYVAKAVQAMRKFSAKPVSKLEALNDIERRLHVDQYSRLKRLADNGHGSELIYRFDGDDKAGQYKRDAVRVLLRYWAAQAAAQGNAASASALRRIAAIRTAKLDGALAPERVKLADAQQKTNPGQWKTDPAQDWYRNVWLRFRGDFERENAGSYATQSKLENAARAEFAAIHHMDRRTLKDRIDNGMVSLGLKARRGKRA
ncbi:hypothetical protein [Pseudoxanthomonas koreensis]|uniref:hypothetical protein n=1 Tax=Pseudoxanthomonas koreensis TaxID=266061 RepID=UPI001391653E|nr:hypothetical protein [Pseudoxanthomonas koreensis]